MFGIGPTEILLILFVFVLLLATVAFPIIVVISVVKYYLDKRDAGVEARIEALEKRLDERPQQK